MNTILRWISVAVAAALLALVCSQHERGGLKGSAVPPANVMSSIVAAAIATMLVRYGFRTRAAMVAAPFVGGIAGALAAGGPSYGPYAGVVGLLVGTIVVLMAAPPVGRRS